MRTHTRRRRRILLAVGAGLGVMLAGCTTSDPTPGVPTASASTSTTSSATPSTTASASATAVPSASPAPAAPTTPEPTQPAPAPAASEVTVNLTFAGWLADTASVEAGAWIDGHVEQGGVCTLRLERDGAVVTAVADAQPDASTTTCGGLAVPAASLSGGTWSATVEYASATSVGRSAPTEVVVP